MRRTFEPPFLLVIVTVSALAMLVPALHAAALSDFATARAFFYSAVLLGVLLGVIGLALANRKLAGSAGSQFRTLILTYLLLPLVMSLPFSWAVPDTRWFNVWFEMVSCFTTTGATLYDTPGRLPPSVHLWRGMVGWMGGFFVLLCASAILAPLNLGGFEVFAPRAVGRQSSGSPALLDPALRLRHHARVLLPVFALATGVLWVALLLAGEVGLVALMHAMAVLSTSGISPVQGLAGSTSGPWGEVLMFCFLGLALTRRALPGLPGATVNWSLWRDPELRIGLALVVALPLVLFVRHFVGAVESELTEDAALAVRSLWGTAFTAISFLSTAGFVSESWQIARVWSGLESPGLILVGLAMMGGGVATTAGGVKLLRVYVLYRTSQRELERLVYPSSIGLGGRIDRSLRQQGANLAFVFFMLFALTLGALNLALAAAGLPFENALILSVAALTTTGPLAGAVSEVGAGYVALGDAAKAVLAVGMIVGRLETLALVAFLVPRWLAR